MGCAKVLTDALVQGGIKKPSKIAPNRGRGFVIVLGEFAHDADVSAVAKTVNKALTPHREQVAPGVSLELFAGTKGAKLDAAKATAALEAITKLKGVDAKGSKVDPARGVLVVRLTGDGKLTVNELIATAKKAGVDTRVATGS